MYLFYYAPALPAYSTITLPDGTTDELLGDSHFGESIFPGYQIKTITGIDPDTTGIIALNQLGIYPAIVPTIQPWNPQLWTPTWKTELETVAADQNENHIIPHFNDFEEYSLEEVPWYNQAGEYARAEWGFLAQNQSDMTDIAKTTLLRLGVRILRNRRNYLTNNKWGNFTDPTGGTTDVYWRDANNSWLDYIQQKINSITESLTTEQLNHIVSPAIGRVVIIKDADNPTQLLRIEYDTFYGTELSKYGTEFYFPATDTTLTYDLAEGIQPGAVDLITADDQRCHIRVTDTGVVIDELDLITASRSMTAALYAENYDTYRADPEDPDFATTEFGFHLYDFSDVSDFVPEINPEPLLDVADIIGRHAEDPTFGSVILDVAEMVDAADDTAAAAANVVVGGLYRTGSVLKVRVS